MKKLVFLLFSFLLGVNAHAAVKIVECEDEQGNRSFQKTCPPGSTQISEKQFKTGTSSDEDSNNNINISATLYLIPDCESCEEVKEFLDARNISYTEKDVSDDLELQKELTDLSGSLKVPTTVIGDEILTGYSRSNFMAALENEGFSAEDED